MKVVAVHGIGNQFEAAETIRAAWLPPLNGGLQEAGFPLLDPAEFAAIFFGSIFRLPGKRGSAIGVSPEDECWLNDLLFEFTREAARLSEQNRGINDPAGEDPRIQAP